MILSSRTWLSVLNIHVVCTVFILMGTDGSGLTWQNRKPEFKCSLRRPPFRSTSLSPPSTVNCGPAARAWRWPSPTEPSLRVMFTRRLSWLTTSSLYLLFASPALSGHSPPTTTPYDPFHAIAALAPKPREEPVCCLKPLTPLEPVDDDLFLSFEDWKARRFSEAGHHGHSHGQKNNAPSNAGAESPAEAVAVAHSTATTVDTITNLSSSSADDAVDAAHAPELTDSASTAAQSAGEGTTSVPLPPPLPPPPPHFRVPLTDRFNYASVDCSARVHTAQPAAAAKSAANILSSQRDRYMLSQCGATPRFVVVELCEDIRIDTVQLANFEFFSGVFREFMVSVAKTYIATDAEGWTVVGTYVGKNVRGVQVRETLFVPLFLPFCSMAVLFPSTSLFLVVSSTDVDS
jgi:hypothetical protein